MEASPHLNPKRGPFSGSRLLQTQPDGVLCRLALRGNPAAFEALYNRHHGALYGFVFHLLGRGASAEDAEDIAQESFSTAFSKLADRRDDGSFKSWLFTIARNRAVDHMRAGRPPTADVTELPLAAAGGPERQAESKAEMAWLMTALADLPERQREALVMREMGGLSYDEIADGMETTVPGVKQLINRARGTLNEAADVSDCARAACARSLRRSCRCCRSRRSAPEWRRSVWRPPAPASRRAPEASLPRPRSPPWRWRSPRSAEEQRA